MSKTKRIVIQAAVLTTVYFSCFLLGRLAAVCSPCEMMLQCSVCRFSGVLVSHLLSPATVILTSLACSLLTAALLLLAATHSLASLYTGVGAMGYFVSLQFASGDR